MNTKVPSSAIATGQAHAGAARYAKRPRCARQPSALGAIVTPRRRPRTSSFPLARASHAALRYCNYAVPERE